MLSGCAGSNGWGASRPRAGVAVSMTVVEVDAAMRSAMWVYQLDMLCEYIELVLATPRLAIRPPRIQFCPCAGEEGQYISPAWFMDAGMVTINFLEDLYGNLEPSLRVSGLLAFITRLLLAHPARSCNCDGAGHVFRVGGASELNFTRAAQLANRCFFVRRG